MAEDQTKILKGMSSITGKMHLDDFAKMVGLTPDLTLKYMRELVSIDFLRKVGRGYAITEKGAIALKVFNSVPEGTEFHFYTEIGHYTGLSANSLKSFCEISKKVAASSLEFHFFRGDFENWMKTAFNDKQLADEFTHIRKLQLRGEDLRKEMVKASESRCNYFESFLHKSQNK